VARADDSQRRRFGGDPHEGVPGAVGTELGLLRRVVESGNPRERIALFFYAMHNFVVGELLGVDVRKPDLLQAEQAQRKPISAADVVMAVPLPDEVDPALSLAEWMTVENGRLPWRPASVRYQVPVSESVQRDAHRTGGLIWTSTAGSVYLMARAVHLMQQHWGIEVDYAVLQRLLVGANIEARHHTMHEAMRGFQIAADELHLPAPEYADDWYVDDRRRYRQLLPEQVLRTHVARGGLFPDEHALDLPLVDPGGEEARPSGVGEELMGPESGSRAHGPDRRARSVVRRRCGRVHPRRCVRHPGLRTDRRRQRRRRGTGRAWRYFRSSDGGGR
jgi:hypothetical protein